MTDEHPLPEVTPTAKAMADEAGIDLARVSGTGAGGKVTVDDVRRAIAERETTKSMPPAGEPNPGLPGGDSAQEAEARRKAGAIERPRAPGTRRFFVAAGTTHLSHGEDVFEVEEGMVDLPRGERWYADLIGVVLFEQLGAG